MLAVVKTPHTNLRIEGDIPRPVLRVLKAQYGRDLVVREGSQAETADIFSTEWYRTRKRAMTPGKYVRIYRENAGFTQEELGGKLGGFSRRYISDLENGRRAISRKTAQALTEIFGQPIGRFL